jgi:hypothetical protein
MKKGLKVKININNKYGYGITTGNITIQARRKD